ILLGRKGAESMYRLFGGFSESFTESYEDDVLREVEEEAGLVKENLSYPKYVCSALIDDWRYRAETVKIKTLLVELEYLGGTPRAGDDISVVRWFPLQEVLDNPENYVMVEHIKLIKLYRDSKRV